MESRKNTLAEEIILNSSRKGSVSIPLNGIINQIRLKIKGTYTGTDANLDAEAPYNILRSLVLSTSKGHTAYALASKDMRIVNYLDKKGRVKTSMNAGNYQMNIILDRGELLGFTKDSLPSKLDNEVLPYGGLTLEVTWATDLDLGTTDIVLVTGTIEIELEETPATQEELQALYGDELERYQFPQLTVQGDVDLTVNTAVKKALLPATGGLKKRIIMVTSTGADVRSDVVVSDIQLKNKQVGEEQLPVDRNFESMNNEDKEQYDLSTALTGVASIDIPREITNDRFGWRSWNFDEKLQLHTLNLLAGKLRIIEESKIVNIPKFEEAILLGLI